MTEAHRTRSRLLRKARKPHVQGTRYVGGYVVSPHNLLLLGKKKRIKLLPAYSLAPPKVLYTWASFLMVSESLIRE